MTLILSSYQAIFQSHAQAPRQLDGLAALPMVLQTVILKLLQRAPLNSYLQMAKMSLSANRLHDVFVSLALQNVTAG